MMMLKLMDKRKWISVLSASDMDVEWIRELILQKIRSFGVYEIPLSVIDITCKYSVNLLYSLV